MFKGKVVELVIVQYQINKTKVAVLGESKVT